MAKQDEKLRLRRRLQDQAIDAASMNRWDQALELNKQILGLGEDADAYNRLGKAYIELGQFVDARSAYQSALKLMSTNQIARKNLQRLDALLARGIESAQIHRSTRQQVDLRLFITETGKTSVTRLVDVQRGPVTDALVNGEKVDLQVDGRSVYVVDADGNRVGRLEPKIAQRLAELIAGGNRYTAAIAQADYRHLRVLIREIYQHPSQRGRISFPGKLSEGLRSIGAGLRDEFLGDELIEEEETTDEREDVEEEYVGGEEEEEIGLDAIDQDISEDDDQNEE